MWNLAFCTLLLLGAVQAKPGDPIEPPLAMPDNVWDFTEGSLDVKREGYQAEKFLFRLLVPAMSRDPANTRKYPLIVWIHGHGFTEFGTRNVGQLKFITESILIQFDDPSECNFFLLAVQDQDMSRQWFGPQLNLPDGRDPLIEPGEAVYDVLQHVLDEYPIDADRVSIVGISSGGTAAWELVMRYPDHFAAVLPSSSSGGDLKRISQLKNVPFWAFNSSRDTSPELANRTLSAVNALRASGGAAWLTLVSGEGPYLHDTAREAFIDHGALDWLLDQRRGQASWRSKWMHFRHIYLRPINAPTWCAIFAVLLMAGIAVRRKMLPVISRRLASGRRADMES